MTKHVVTQTPNDHTTKAGVAIRPFDLEHDLATIVKSDNAMSTELTINRQSIPLQDTDRNGSPNAS